MDVIGHPLSVLIVEKCRDTASTTAQILGFDGHVVRIARCAEEAYEMAEAEPPDVVLLDLYLPRTAGCEIARRLNSLGVCKPPVLIAISGSTSERDKKRMMDAGCHLYLVKPVEPAVLCGLMRRLARALGPVEGTMVSDRQDVDAVSSVETAA